MKTGRLALVVALLAAGCNNNTTAPSTTTPQVPTATVLFSGALVVQGATSSAPISIATAGTLRITLASLTTSNSIGTTSVPVSVAVGLAVGTVNADGVSCDINPSINSVTATPGLTSQLSVSVPVGTTCVQIFDAGALATTGPVNFVIRIVHT